MIVKKHYNVKDFVKYNKTLHEEKIYVVEHVDIMRQLKCVTSSGKTSYPFEADINTRRTERNWENTAKVSIESEHGSYKLKNIITNEVMFVKVYDDTTLHTDFNYKELQLIYNYRTFEQRGKFYKDLLEKLNPLKYFRR